MENNLNIKSHRDLDVWKLSVEFALSLYHLTEHFPNTEKYGLVSQIRRSGISICSNIAEGAARGYTQDYIRFLGISLGSVAEVETQLEISCRLGYLRSIDTEIIIVKRLIMMLRGMIKKLESKSS